MWVDSIRRQRKESDSINIQGIQKAVCAEQDRWTASPVWGLTVFGRFSQSAPTNRWRVPVNLTLFFKTSPFNCCSSSRRISDLHLVFQCTCQNICCLQWSYLKSSYLSLLLKCWEKVCFCWLVWKYRGIWVMESFLSVQFQCDTRQWFKLTLQTDKCTFESHFLAQR